MNQYALLALEDGSLFQGVAIGAGGNAVGEVVFNTAMTGYQEILTDPSYARQLITLTYPHIGNVGTNPDDEESFKAHAGGLIIRDLSIAVSNWRSTQDLNTYLKDQGVVGITEIDTRQLTHVLRDKGALRGCITMDIENPQAAIEKAQSFGGLEGLDLAQEVTVAKHYTWLQGSWGLGGSKMYEEKDLEHHIVAYDFGVKRNMLRLLVDRGCRVTVVPAKTSAEDVLALNPNGILLSNGPGDPAPCDYAIEATKTLIEKGIPIFGICLGFQILALAAGAKTIKMKFGHHGANHPVQDCRNQAVMITSQNHGFAVDENSLPSNVEVTHRSLFDGTLQGIRLKDKPVFGFQGHPEASPGPNDLYNLFNEFIQLLG